MVLQKVDSIYDIEWRQASNTSEVRLREEVEAVEIRLQRRHRSRARRVLGDPPLAVRQQLQAGRVAPCRPGLVLPALEHTLKLLAPVQHPRCKQQHRRDRAGRVHPELQEARDRSGQGLRRADEPRATARAGRGRVGGARTIARVGLRGDSGQLAPGAHEGSGRCPDSQPCASGGCRRKRPSKPTARRGASTARIERIPERQTDLEELVTGPPVAAAFKPDGTPTPAAAGFAAKQGVEVPALERIETPKGV